MTPTRFSVVYNNFLSKITDDMYLELTEQDTQNLLRELVIVAIHKFEFPRHSLEYVYAAWKEDTGQKDQKGQPIMKDVKGWTFIHPLTYEEINIISTYMIVEWLGQQLASIENVRMKYSGPDFKFTSQANHMQKILQMKKDYERQGFHLQRLYKRRILDVNGIYHSTMPKIMEPMNRFPVDPRTLPPGYIVPGFGPESGGSDFRPDEGGHICDPDPEWKDMDDPDKSKDKDIDWKDM